MSQLKQVARNILELEKQRIPTQDPVGIAISLLYKKDHYIGTIQQIALDYSPEIVLLSKSSKPIDPKLHEAILELDENRVQLTADERLDLEGLMHVARRVEYNLTSLTKEQYTYMQAHTYWIKDDANQVHITPPNPN